MSKWSSESFVHRRVARSQRAPPGPGFASPVGHRGARARSRAAPALRGRFGQIHRECQWCAASWHRRSGPGGRRTRGCCSRRAPRANREAGNARRRELPPESPLRDIVPELNRPLAAHGSLRPMPTASGSPSSRRVVPTKPSSGRLRVAQSPRQSRVRLSTRPSRRRTSRPSKGRRVTCSPRDERAISPGPPLRKERRAPVGWIYYGGLGAIVGTVVYVLIAGPVTVRNRTPPRPSSSFQRGARLRPPRGQPATPSPRRGAPTSACGPLAAGHSPRYERLGGHFFGHAVAPGPRPAYAGREARRSSAPRARGQADQAPAHEHPRGDLSWEHTSSQSGARERATGPTAVIA